MGKRRETIRWTGVICLASRGATRRRGRELESSTHVRQRGGFSFQPGTPFKRPESGSFSCGCLLLKPFQGPRWGGLRVLLSQEEKQRTGVLECTGGGRCPVQLGWMSVITVLSTGICSICAHRSNSTALPSGGTGASEAPRPCGDNGSAEEDEGGEGAAGRLPGGD
jgi:hypothetical protein